MLEHELKFYDAGVRDERARVSRYLRTTPLARGVLIGSRSSKDIARLSQAIESGEHDAAGATPAGALPDAAGLLVPGDSGGHCATMAREIEGLLAQTRELDGPSWILAAGELLRRSIPILRTAAEAEWRPFPAVGATPEAARPSAPGLDSPGREEHVCGDRFCEGFSMGVRAEANRIHAEIGKWLGVRR